MKTKTLSLLVILMSLFACSKEEPAHEPGLGSTICFDEPSIVVDGGESVRATGPVDRFPAGGSFGVLGYCLANYDGSQELNPATGPSPWASKGVMCTPHLFYRTEVKYNGTACYYTGVQRRWYDPADYLYTFLAYSPYENAFHVEPETQSGLGFPVLTYNMPFADGTLSAPLNIDDIPDAMVAAAVDVMRQDGHVKLSFQHLLAGINFKVNNYNVKNDLTIHGLRVSGNFYRSMKIRMNKGLEYPSDTFAGTFSFLNGDDSGDDLLVAPRQTGQRAGDKTLMLISNLQASAPEYLGNLIEIHIDYTFMGTYTKDKVISFAPDYLPHGGTIYTIELNFIGDTFVLNFVVDDNQMWEDGGDSDIKFE